MRNYISMHLHDEDPQYVSLDGWSDGGGPNEITLDGKFDVDDLRRFIDLLGKSWSELNAPLPTPAS